MKGTHLIVLVLLSVSQHAGVVVAKNCTKGQPCGNACIAWNKTCRIHAAMTPSGKSAATRDGKQSAVGALPFYESRPNLPEAYVVIVDSLRAKIAPNASEISAHYTKGQTVFVYRIFESWAQLTNSQPDQWVEAQYLQRKK